MPVRKLAVLPVGERVGQVTVLGVLDSGARQNTVYIGWHHKAWCPVACKVFRSPRQAEDEANILAALAHPNIVRFLEFGREPAHLVMEFLEGPRLRDRLQSKSRLGVSDAIRVAMHVGAALLHMHERALLHLDVKPSNIVIANGRPVLFDFGSARPRSEWGRACLEGTDPYMAPEQCLRQPVSPATDVFGLAVTLYEMLTGKLPFPAGTRARPFPQIETEATPARRHRPLPTDLDHLLLRCLARDRERRPVLEEILPRLHDFIRSGPPMWPSGFHPGSNATATIA